MFAFRSLSLFRSRRWSALSVLFCLGLTAWCAQPARAQAAAYYSGVTSTVGSGFSNPHGVAVDASGNVFVADQTSNAVKEIVAVNGQVSASSTVKTVGSGFNQPYGVAVDASGNIFVADSGNNAVKEIVANSSGQVSASSTVKTVGSGFNDPTGVAVDTSGDVFVANSGTNAVKEIVANSSGQVSASSTVITVGSGFSEPQGVAVDAGGDVFVADTFNSAVKEIVAVNGQVSASSTVKTVGSGFFFPGGVALDASGDVFVANSGTNAVKEIVANSSGQVSASSTVKTVGSGFSRPTGVAVDADGDVFIADYYHNAVKEVQFGAVHFGSVDLGKTSSTVQVPFTFTASGQLSGWKVFTRGATGKDFTEASAGTTCSTTTTYSSGNTCSVAVQFSPLHPGLRMGAVQLEDSSGNPIATARLKGVGVGPQVVFPSHSSSSVIGGGFSQPRGVAVDAAGDVFVADSGNNSLKEIVADHGQVSSSSKVITLGYSFSQPYGVAVDANGDVFVADTYNNAVKEIVANSSGQVSASSPIKEVGSGFNGPTGVAVDARGDVFIADTYFTSQVKEIVAVNGQVSPSSRVITLGGGFSYPFGLAVDANGDLFVADSGNNEVKEIVAVNGAVSPSSTIKTVGSGFNQPTGVAVDPAGDVFVADYGNKEVKEIVAVNGQVSVSSTVKTVAGGFFDPFGVAVDAGGNLFVADTGSNEVKELPLATPPSYVFPTATNVGSTDSTDGPFTVTVANDGNSTLTFPIPTTAGAYNPSVSNNFTYDNTSTCTQNAASAATAFTLAPGAGCAVVTDFTPQTAGSITGNVVLTDDTLNAASPTYAMQSIDLGGTANAVAPDPPTSLVATSGNAQATISFTPPTFTGGDPITSYTATSSPGGFTATCAASPCTVTGLTNGTAYTFTVTATNSAKLTSTASSPSSAVTPLVSQTITFTNPGPQTYGSPVTLTATASSGLTVTFTSATPAICTVTSAGQLSPIGVGTCTINANQSGNGTYAAATQVSRSFAVNKAPLKITANSTTKVYGTANPSFTGMVKGAVNGDTFTESFSTTATTTSAVGTYPITPSVTGTHLADYTVTKVNGSLTVKQATPIIQWPQPASIVYGTPLSGKQLDATASYNGSTVAGTFTYSPAAGALVNAGTDTLSATFTPADATDYTTAMASVTVTVTKAASAVALTSSTSNANLNANVTFTATVTSQSSGTPTGSVEFLDGSTVLGTGPLNNNGVATYTTSSLTAGLHKITAVYQGDVNFTGSTSAALAQIVTAPSFSLTSSTTYLALKAGQTGKVTLHMIPVGGFKGNVQFNCVGLPAGSKCAFSPSTATADGSNTTQISTLSITAGGSGAVALMVKPGKPDGIMMAGMFWLPALFLGGFLFWQRRKVTAKYRVLLILLVAAATLSGTVGCGSPPQTYTGTPAVFVRGTSGSSSQVVTIRLKITQ